jgi:hypothetical protein
MSEADYMADCEAENWDVSDSEYYAGAALVELEDNEADRRARANEAKHSVREAERWSDMMALERERAMLAAQEETDHDD